MELGSFFNSAGVQHVLPCECLCMCSRVSGGGYLCTSVGWGVCVNVSASHTPGTYE